MKKSREQGIEEEEGKARARKLIAEYGIADMTRMDMITSNNQI